MSIRLLLADDHEIFRAGMRALLEAEEAMEVVAETGDGREAVSLVEYHRPDVCLVDIAMPELNGIELTRRISSRTSVIILTMYSDAEFVSLAMESGACGYLCKSSAGRELTAAIRAVHAGRKYWTPTAFPQNPSAGEKPRRVSPWHRLSEREREVVQLVAEGWSSADIAERLYLSRKTVETYRSRAMAKLGARNMAELIKFAVRHGMTPLD